MQAPALATWALTWARRAQRPRLPRGPGGRPRTYPDETVLLMAIIQTAWRMSYADIIDYVASHESLAALLGCTSRRSDGTLQTISQGQYWERRAALGILPFLVFFLALVGQLIRLGVISGHELLVDSTRLRAWRHNDPGAAWSRCRGKATLYGYKVHTVLCRQAQLPVFVVLTAANVHDSLIGLLSVTASVMLFGLHVAVVYADAAYFDRRFLSWVQQHLHARPAVDYNPRRKGKRQLARLPFLRYWRRAVLGPRAATPRHFAQLKRYFGLKFFQCARRDSLWANYTMTPTNPLQ